MASLLERESSFCDKSLPNNISRALYSQKQKAIFCDIIMRICGAEMFAHSAVLAAASPYFSSFLSQDLPRQFSQRSPQIIEIQIDGSETNAAYAEAVTAVIDFIYTGVLHLKTSTVVQVSELARIMQLEAVLRFCEDFFTVQNKPSSEPPGVKTTDQGTNTEADDTDDGPTPFRMVMTTGPLKSKTVSGMSLGSKSLYVHPVGMGPQKLFKAGKLVSTSTQVTPQLLGIHPPTPPETKDCKTQTHVKDFPEKLKTYARYGRRKQQSTSSSKHETVPITIEPIEESNGSEIVMEITRTKLRPASVRVIKQENGVGPRGDAGDYINSQGNMDSTDVGIQSVDTPYPPSYDAENEEFFEMFGDSSRRRSGRKTKPTPKIIALRHRGVPLKIKQEPALDENQPDDLPNQEEIQRKSPRKTKLVPREEGCVPDTIPEQVDMEQAADSADQPLVTQESIKPREGEERTDNPNEQEANPGPEVIQSVPHVTRLSPKKKPTVRIRRGKRLLKKFTCSECNFQTNKVREFTCHKRLHKMESNICYYCEEKYVTKEELNEHFEKHKGPLPYFCPICDGRYKSKTQLNIHLPKHSTDKPFVCEVCSAGFKWKHALKNHMVVHSNRKDHLCDQCGYATAHKCQLKAHKLIHTGETYRCPVQDCHFQATKRQNLKYHLLTHTREKPHQCEICGQSFSLIKNMRRHMLLHTNNKPCQCDQCDFSTTRFDKLKEHMLKLHGMGSPPEKRVRVADLVQDYTTLVVDPAELEAEGTLIAENQPLGEQEPMEVGGGIAAPLVATVTAEELMQASSAGGVMGDAQTLPFVPGQTIIITQTGQDGEVQTHEVSVPAHAGLLEAAQCEQVQNALQFTEVMIPASQLSEYVQELAFVQQA